MVTDRRRAPTTDALLRRIAVAARVGVQLVHIREPDLEARALLDLVRAVVAAVRGSGMRVLVNDRLDVALAGGAHGVHLRSDSMPAPRARSLVPPGFLVGRSVHAVDEAARARAAGGLDYLLFGTVFETSSKPGVAAAGAAKLGAVVAAAAGVPVLGIGGVTTAERAGALSRSGCAGLAAIGLFADRSAEALPETLAAVWAAWENGAR
jgi:thiamine-phosphate diphosphorylase